MSGAIHHGLVSQSATQHRSTPNSHSIDKDDANRNQVPARECDELPHTIVRVRSGVDVKAAQEAFVHLDRQMSAQSQRISYHLHKGSISNTVDIEKALSTSSDNSITNFSLEETLRGNRQAELDAGIKTKSIGVIWENLTVRGIGGAKNFVKVFPDALIDFVNVPGTIMQLCGWRGKDEPFNILSSFNGVAKPGEMVLVLGRPGSGCTTFLKVISNQRYGYSDIDGEVTYGPFSSKEFARLYRGEAVYNSEDDIHHPTLTVGQTLGFALDVKTPGKRPVGMSKKDFKEKVIGLFLKMFNIEHTVDTIVGNPFLRGISGGERKRVSIAEMMATGATVCAWDNSTRGLDSSTALDYAKSLRILTNIYQTTTFVSLYQASESIYKQFDKVMVIDSGRQVYFGSIGEARAYFEDLGFSKKPRQTTPDYLTGCTDPFERTYQEGRGLGNAPVTPDDLAKCFRESRHALALADQMMEYRQHIANQAQQHEDFRMANRDSKRKHTSEGSVYTVSYMMQVWALIRRQFLIKWQDKFSLTVSWTTSVIIAIILGTLFLNLPTTSAGAFTRGGVIFISLLFNAFEAFAELASTMLGRAIVNKHRAYSFHRPSALWFAQIVVDMAFVTVKILVFSVIVYFMCGLVRTPAAFFTFVLIIVIGYLSMTLFFRTLGCLCPDFDYAIKFVAVIITLYVLTCGYLIQYDNTPVWLRWIFYINALGLGFSAMMINEFEKLELKCTSESLIPSGPGYANIQNQVCTLPGSQAGSDVVSGADYIETAFSYHRHDLWRNFVIIMGFIILFMITNATLGEWVKFGAGGRTITYFQKENAERKRLNKELLDRKHQRHVKPDHDMAKLNIESKAVLTWEGLNYDVPVQGGKRRLLNEVFGYVQPGQLTALMGASGAGKTTLLDVLAARKNIGVISGDVLVDGLKPGKSFQRGTSYAEQLDIHESTQTVREALRFSADLRQSYDMPRSEKYSYVEEIILLLELENLADAIIGDPDSGLSVEERKRVTIGVELAAKPELLLFLDEPTSGLDSQSAFNIVRFLRKLAKAGQAILCTIHQPNSTLFESFDRLLLLQKGGECVYFGDIGQDACVLIDYFAKNGAYCPPEANPAEWMLNVIGAGIASRVGDKDWGEIWRESDEFATTKAEIVAMRERRLREVDSKPLIEQREYATPLWHQIQIVCRRTSLAFWRSPNYGFTRLYTHVAIALMTGLCFVDLDQSRTSLQNRVFVLFQITVIPALILAQVEPKYDISRLIFYRESAAKAYKQLPFALSMVIAEVPYSLLSAIGFFLPIYYLPGFSHVTSRAGYQFLMVLITELFAVTLGQMISALTPSTFTAALLNPFCIITFCLFCGVAVPRPQIPPFWRAWLYPLDPFTRLISGMVTTELHDLPVTCTPEELNVFSSPIGQTCGEYMSDFFKKGGPGYLLNNATQLCQYCAYGVGNQFYTALGLDYGSRWRDMGIFAAFIGSNLILLFVGSRYLNFNRR